MNCYYHPEKAAIGLCKSCGRGICKDCAHESEISLACRGRCEERTQRIDDMFEDSRTISKTINPQSLITSIFSVIAGFLFAGIGYSINGLNGNTTGLMIGLLGIVFAVRGIITIINVIKYTR